LRGRPLTPGEITRRLTNNKRGKYYKFETRKISGKGKLDHPGRPKGLAPEAHLPRKTPWRKLDKQKH